MSYAYEYRKDSNVRRSTALSGNAGYKSEITKAGNVLLASHAVASTTSVETN